MKFNFEIIGFIAASLTTIAFIPQVYRTYSTGKTDDISITMYVILCTGLFMWIIYGYSIEKKPIIWANLISLGLTFSILYLAFTNKNKNNIINT